jgi:hypothetical protein
MKYKDSDIIGVKFGRLLPIKRIDIKNKNNRNVIYYECNCDCGATNITVLKSSLIRGDTKSCGCLQKERMASINFKDLTNQKFGKLTVIKKVEKPNHRKNRGSYWLCKCDCGNEKDIILSSSELNSGNTQSCGCISKERLIKFNKINKKKYNQYDLSGEYGIGYTSKGEEFYFDLEDYNKIKDYCWRVGNKGYIMCTQRQSNGHKHDILFHRLVTNCPENMSVDHINGINTRNDNRKINLRICTHQENLCNYPIPKNNTSGKTGVCWDKIHNVWKAYITYKYKRINLGSFNNYEDAVKIREEAEEKYFGDYRYKI